MRKNSKLAMDDPRFRELFIPELNPGIDPYSLTTKTDKRISYYTDDGLLATDPVFYLFDRKVMNAKSKTVSKKACTDPRFMDIFIQELNPGIDPLTIPSKSKKHIKYYSADGEVCDDRIVDLLNRKNPFKRHRKHPKAWDDLEFRKLFDQELNPDIDPYTLTTGSTKMIRYYDSDGKLASEEVYRLFQRKQRNVRTKKKVKKAWENQEFRNLFVRELNPDVNIDTLTTCSGISISYYTDTGELTSDPVRYLFNRAKMNHKVYRRAHYAMDDEGFKRLFMKELNPNIDPDLLRKNSDKQIRYYTPEGEIESDSVHNIINRRNKNQKRQYKYAKDDDAFMQMFDAALNPDVDLNKLTCFSTTPISYVENGEIVTQRCLEIFQRKNKIRSRKRTPRWAWENAQFRELFSQELNPSIDPHKLRKGSTKEIQYLSSDGEIVTDKICNILKRRSPNKRKKMELACKNSQFMDLFDPELNPQIDLSTLYKNSEKEIRYRNNSGRIVTDRVYRFFCRKSMNQGRAKKRAWEFRQFREIFNRELNPSIDPCSIFEDDNTLFLYYDINGKEVQERVCDFFDGLKKQKTFVRDDPVFMEYYQESWNPGFEIKGATVGCNQIINYCNYKGEMRKASLQAVFSMKFYRKNRKFKRAIDVQGFKDAFVECLNPDVDLTNLSASSTKSILYFAPTGRIRQDTVCNIVQRLKNANKHHAPLVIENPLFMKGFMPLMNPDVDLDTLRQKSLKWIYFMEWTGKIVYNRVDLIIQKINGPRYLNPVKTVNEDPVFWSYCINQKDRKKINSLSRKCDYPIIIECKKCYKKRKTTICEFYRSIERSGCPCSFCSVGRVIPGKNDAATLDDELELFWTGNLDDLHKLSPFTSHKKDFKCPYCGHEFQDIFSKVAFRFPKCPKCHDLGLLFNEGEGINDEILMPAGMPFVSRI